MPGKTITASQLRTEATQADRNAHESFDRCDTDGFVSQWASGLTARLKRLEADILDNGGVWTFPGLFDLEGHRVRAKLIPGRYGTCWALCDAHGQFTGQFVKAYLRPHNLAKKGYIERDETALARAKLHGSGYGLSGATSVQPIVERLDGGYPDTAV